MPYRLAEILDSCSLQPMLDLFYKALGMTAKVWDLNSQEIVSGPVQPFVRDFCQVKKYLGKARVHDINEHLADKQDSLQKFSYPGNIYEYSTPILVENQIIGRLTLGFFLHRLADVHYFSQLAHELQIAEDEFLSAVRQIPVVSEAQAEGLIMFLVQIIQRLFEYRLSAQRSTNSIASAKGPLTNLGMTSPGLDAGSQRRMEEENEHSARRVENGERHFETALTDTPVTVFHQDLNLRYIWVYNAESFADKPMIGKTDGDLFSAEDAERLTALKQRVIGIGLLTREEIALSRGDKTYYFDMTLAPLYNSEGAITGITCAAWDITNLKVIEEQLRRKLVESESIKRIIKGLLQKIGLDEVLEIVCSEAMQLTGAKGSAVLLLEDNQWLRLTHRIGVPEYKLERLPVEGSFAGIAINSGHPVWINRKNESTDDLPDQLHGYPWTPGLNSMLSVPLIVDEKPIGVLNILDKAEDITVEDIRIIELFADQAAMIIEHVRLQRQAEQFAVLKERQRLARELHDSVTQALYSVTLYADASRMAFTAQRWDALERNLQEVHNMAREAMYDMRLLVFELHPYMLEKEGLASALRARLAAVEGRSGLKSEVRVKNEKRLPTYLEEELYRIAQEGLNNVVKHAEAEEILIDIDYLDDSVRLEITDDGKGFDPEVGEHEGGMGLRGIKERVRQLNGTLELISESNKGTSLIVSIPVGKT